MLVDSYKSFVEQVCALINASLLFQAASFSVDLIRHSKTFNSVYYILNFWTKLVSAYGVSCNEDLPFISSISQTIASTFMEVQLSRVESPVSNEDGLASEQLDRSDFM